MFELGLSLPVQVRRYAYRFDAQPYQALWSLRSQSTECVIRYVLSELKARTKKCWESSRPFLRQFTKYQGKDSARPFESIQPWKYRLLTQIWSIFQTSLYSRLSPSNVDALVGTSTCLRGTTLICSWYFTISRLTKWTTDFWLHGSESSPSRLLPLIQGLLLIV